MAIFHKLAVENYRRFPRLDIDFDPKLTVIAARNGQGKTSILEAIAVALGPFVGAFDNGKSKHIEASDARFRNLGYGYENEQSFPVVINACLSSPSIQWQRALSGRKNRTTTREASPLANWGKELQYALRQDHGVALPLVAYYSSRRLWVSHKNTGKRNVLTESRAMGYEDCLSPSSNYTQLQQWIKKATYSLLQQQQKNSFSAEIINLGDRLSSIKNAVNEVMASENWCGFEYSIALDDLAMSHPDHGLLPLSLLSDGVRAVISLTADIAFRCARLNGHFGELAAKETKGVILIDEVDLHLHPAWQQRILQSLQVAFPEMQFIVSTHSPQVLSTVASSCIRLVFQDTEENWQAVNPAQEVKGLESAVALNDIMGVNPIPPIAEARWLADYTALIESGEDKKNPGAQKLYQDLIALYGQMHPVILNLEKLKRFQKIKLRNNKE